MRWNGCLLSIIGRSEKCCSIIGRTITSIDWEGERERVGRDNEALLCINEGTVSVQNSPRLHKLGARFSFHSLLAGAHFSLVSNQYFRNNSTI